MPPNSSLASVAEPTQRAQSARARERPAVSGLSSAASPLGERLLESALLCCALLSVLTTAGIVGVLAWETLAFFRTVPFSRLLLDTARSHPANEFGDTKRFTPGESGWAAVCYGLVRHPEFLLY